MSVIIHESGHSSLSFENSDDYESMSSISTPVPQQITNGDDSVNNQQIHQQTIEPNEDSSGYNSAISLDSVVDYVSPIPTQKQHAAIICQYWFRSSFLSDSTELSLFLVDEIVSFYLYHELLSFHPIYHSMNGWEMRENHKIAQRSCTNDIRSYAFLMADIEPVSKGIHCWRINIIHKNINQSGWITFGVGPLKHYKGDWNNGARYEDIWGISCTDNYYPDEQQVVHVPEDLDHFFVGYSDFDILLDLERDTLGITAVGAAEDEPAVHFEGVRMINGYGRWVPFLDVYHVEDDEDYHTVGSEFRITAISPELFGQKVQMNIFWYELKEQEVEMICNFWLRSYRGDAVVSYEYATDLINLYFLMN